MTDAVWISVIVSGTAMVSAITIPIITSIIATMGRKAEKAQDYARQDVVAFQASEAARLLAVKQDEIAAQAREAARLLVESNKKQEAERAVTAAKLEQIDATGKVIHVLVNSNMTVAKRAELAATEAQLVLLRKFSPEDIEAIKIVEDQVAVLRAEMKDRKQQQDVVNDSDAGKKVARSMTAT